MVNKLQSAPYTATNYGKLRAFFGALSFHLGKGRATENESIPDKIGFSGFESHSFLSESRKEEGSALRNA